MTYQEFMTPGIHIHPAVLLLGGAWLVATILGILFKTK